MRARKPDAPLVRDGQQIALRLDPEAHAALAELCQVYGLSQRAMLEVLILGKAATVRSLQP